MGGCSVLSAGHVLVSRFSGVCLAQVLYESTICDDYLNDAYPQNPLYPTDPYEKAHTKLMMYNFSKVGG